jgi:hypothetical protein
MKILVNAPNGIQEIIEISESGGYFDPTLVLWDERVDGEMPSITIGAMKREGGNLVYDHLLDSAAILARNKVKAKADITALEATITPRRQREAILGTDKGWLAQQEAAIAVLRAQL